MIAYATVEYADAYLNMLLDVAPWEAADTEAKERALNTATLRIDAIASRPPGFRGRKTSPEQANQFPRVPDKTVPDTVMQACCHEALYLVTLDGDEAAKRRLNDIRQGVRSVSIGDVSESYASASEMFSDANQLLGSADAASLLRPYMAHGGYATV